VATYGDLQTRIADELDRDDLSVQIKRAILSAVTYYARQPFWFTESSFTFSTVNGQETYGSSDNAAIATAPMIERLNGNFFGLRTPMIKRDWEYIDNISTLTTSKATPRDWAYRASQIRVYPIPDRAYTITAYYTPILTALSADSDSNAWTNDAEELIRARSKADLMRNVIRGPDMAQEVQDQMMQERDALAALRGETARRKATGFIQPTEF
jgi:hypothetical protein